MLVSADVTESRKSASEIKFLIDPAAAERIRAWARTRLDPDPHAGGESGDEYRTTSLYLDTRNFDIFHRRGSFGRSKYRIRRYGASENIFLERKLRTSELVSKRRALVGIEELARLCCDTPDEDWPGYWFHRRLLARELRPVCQITYVRTAREARTRYGPVRLTLDKDITGLAIGGLGFEPVQAGVAICHGQQVLELKYAFTMPAIFRQLVAEFKLNPQAISKYRLAAAALGCVPEEIGEGAARPKLNGAARGRIAI
jgi:hypothetical protein